MQHEACNHGFVEIAKLLLDNGALVNVPSQKDNITPLHDALINDQMQIAILLASRGADMHAKYGSLYFIYAWNTFNKLKISDYFTNLTVVVLYDGCWKFNY